MSEAFPPLVDIARCPSSVRAYLMQDRRYWLYQRDDALRETEAMSKMLSATVDDLAKAEATLERVRVRLSHTQSL